MFLHDGLLERDFPMGCPDHCEAALLWGIDPDSRDSREFREITVQEIAVGDDGDVRNSPNAADHRSHDYLQSRPTVDEAQRFESTECTQRLERGHAWIAEQADPANHDDDTIELE